jgi:hypothetical protein
MVLKLMSAAVIFLSLAHVQSTLHMVRGEIPDHSRGLRGSGCGRTGTSRRTPASGLRCWLPLASGIRALRGPITAHWRRPLLASAP